MVGPSFDLTFELCSCYCPDSPAVAGPVTLPHAGYERVSAACSRPPHLLQHGMLLWRLPEYSPRLGLRRQFPLPLALRPQVPQAWALRIYVSYFRLAVVFASLSPLLYFISAGYTSTPWLGASGTTSR